MSRQQSISFRLNGVAVTASVAPHHNLIELLQGQFGLTGARESCGQGLCGCCTVIVNGRAVSGCLYLASFVDGADVATIEGFDASDQLTPEQEAWIEAVTAAGQLKRSKGAEPKEETGGMVDIYMRKMGNPAVVSDDIPDFRQGHRVLANLLTSPPRGTIALGRPPDSAELEQIQWW